MKRALRSLEERSEPVERASATHAAPGYGGPSDDERTPHDTIREHKSRGLSPLAQQLNGMGLAKSTPRRSRVAKEWRCRSISLPGGTS